MPFYGKVWKNLPFFRLASRDRKPPPSVSGFSRIIFLFPTNLERLRSSKTRFSVPITGSFWLQSTFFVVDLHATIWIIELFAIRKIAISCLLFMHDGIPVFHQCLNSAPGAPYLIICLNAFFQSPLNYPRIFGRQLSKIRKIYQILFPVLIAFNECMTNCRWLLNQQLIAHSYNFPHKT